MRDISPTDLVQQLIAIRFWQGDVAYQNIGSRAIEDVQRLARRRCDQDLSAMLFEQPSHEFPGVRFVIDHEDPDGVEQDALRQPRPGRGGEHLLASVKRGRVGQRHGERRALAVAGTLGADGAVVQGGQILDDRESEAKAAEPARARGVRLLEAIKDLREESGANPYAGIGDDDVNKGTTTPQLDPHVPASRRELDAV